MPKSVSRTDLWSKYYVSPLSLGAVTLLMSEESISSDCVIDFGLSPWWKSIASQTRLWRIVLPEAYSQRRCFSSEPDLLCGDCSGLALDSSQLCEHWSNTRGRTWRFMCVKRSVGQVCRPTFTEVGSQCQMVRQRRDWPRTNVPPKSPSWL